MHQSDPAYRESLAGGYLLRWGTAADGPGLDALYGSVFGNELASGYNHHVVGYASALLSGRHPLGKPGDVALVTDAHGTIVAATILMRMAIDYAGKTLQGGRPEIVATLPEHRNRGFIRKIFGLIHARSAAYGDVFQGITGIPYYYKQFGYDYALTLGGCRVYPQSAIPQLAADQVEPFRLRKAEIDDIWQLQMLYERERVRTHDHLPMLVSSHLDATYWQWAIGDTGSHEPWVPYMIVDTNGTSVGSLGVTRVRTNEQLGVYFCNTEPHCRIDEVAGSVLRGVAALAPSVRLWEETVKPFGAVRAHLGVSHPLYTALRTLPHRVEPPYGWYIRVPAYAALIAQIAPALEKRLAQSAYAGYSGTIQVSFYRTGLTLTFARGKLSASDLERPTGEQIAFPPNVFSQLVFGIHSLEELRATYYDIWAAPEVATLMDILFPKQASWVLPLD